MKNSEFRKSDKKLKKAISEGYKTLKEEDILIIHKLHELNETLKKIRLYRNIGLITAAEKLEKQLEDYDGLIDKEYWKEDALMYIVIALMSRTAITVEEACKNYEDYKNAL